MRIDNYLKQIKNSPAFKGGCITNFEKLVDMIMKEFPSISKEIAQMIAKILSK